MLKTFYAAIYVTLWRWQVFAQRFAMVGTVFFARVPCPNVETKSDSREINRFHGQFWCMFSGKTPICAMGISAKILNPTYL